MYLLDTNSVSEVRRPRPDPGLTGWLRRQETEALYTSVIVASEIERGTGLMERRDPVQGAKLRRWFEQQFFDWFGDRILPVDLPIAIKAGEFHVPDPAPRHDALIAATAAVHGLAMVTRNVRDFDRFGVPTVNPWEAPA